MRKFLGNYCWRVCPHILYAVMLILPFSHHNAWGQIHPMMRCMPWYAGPGTITSITPSIWPAGQTIQVTVAGDFPYGDQPGCELNEGDGVWNAPPNAGGDPDSLVKITTDKDGFPKGTFSPTQSTLTVKVAAKHPSANVYLVLDCDGCEVATVGGPVQITAPGPTITSISPSAWFAGRSYDISITGTNFLTTSDPGGPTELKITGPGGNVRISNLVVVSATQITAAVEPAKDLYAGMAVVKATNPATGANPGSGEASEPILPKPIIYDQDGNQLSGDNATTQLVVVGLPINLNTNVMGPPPAGIAITQNTWRVGGTHIGGYDVSPDQSSATVTKTDTTQASLLTHWVYGESGVKIKYHYCVGVSDLTDPCSQDAEVTFDISGPSDGQPTTFDSGLFSINNLIVNPCGPGDLQSFMEYGNYTGYVSDSCPNMGGSVGASGISFTAPTTSSDGTYSFVQIVNHDTESFTESGGVLTCTTASGLDGIYPYPSTSGTTSDSPNVPLDPFMKKVRRNFAATMYLMWTSNQTNSIPVPIGYQKWQLQETSSNPGAPTGQNWTDPISTLHGPNGQFVPVDPSQKHYGYPTWSLKATFSCPTTAQMMTELESEDEQ